jgi:chemotaxis protein CheZ
MVEMALPRKVFRIEKMVARRSAPVEATPANSYDDLKRELSALRTLLATNPVAASSTPAIPQAPALQRVQAELRQMHAAIGGLRHGATSGTADARIMSELEAVIQHGETATQKILAAAEDIDQAANNLSAALKEKCESGLAQDIRDRVIQIFEACNFQDLSSQRVAKVMGMLASLERQIAAALESLAQLDAKPPVHGPRLQGDLGHATQSDVDSLFEGDLASGSE